MSTKGTIMLTGQDEHWYQDVSYPGFQVVMEINHSSILEKGEDTEQMYVILKPESQLARALNDPAVRKALDAAIEKMQEAERNK